MAAPSPKPKFTTTTIIIYVVIAVLFAIGGMILGTTMDYSLTNGKVDTAKFNFAISYVMSHFGVVLHQFSAKGSYAQKMTFLAVMSFGLYVLYKFAEDAKRTHRRGSEHGSAKWGNLKEMESLADANCTYRFPNIIPFLKIKIPNKKDTSKKQLMTLNGKYVTDDNGNNIHAKVDNNILLSKEVKLSLNARQHLLNHNILIVGGSGSGKTRFYAKPNVMQMNTSYVITDPKGEILQSTGKMLQAAGYEVRVLNLIDMQNSNNYNPFEYVYDYNGNLSADNVKKMVRVLFDATKGDGEKTDFWSQKGQTMLEAIVYLLFDESEYDMEKDADGNLIPETRDKTHLNFFSVTEKMRKLRYPPKGSKKKDGFFLDDYAELDKNDDEDEDAYNSRIEQNYFLCPLDKDYIELYKRKGETLAYRLYKEVRNAPEETGQSFLSSANVKTFMFNLPSLRNLTCCDNIHLETLGDKKTALYLILSATDSTYNFMAAMLYTQMFDVLANRANFKYKAKGQKLPVPVRCIMDEFANLGQIPDFEKVIAFVRSMGMSLNVIVQNTAQLKAKYEKTWEVITGNCDTLLFLGGKEESTLKYISEALGKETIDVRGVNRTKGKSPSTSENNSILGRELLQPNEISTMPIDECLVMMRSHNAFYCKKYPIEQHPNAKFLEENGGEKWMFDVSDIHSISVEEFENMQKDKIDTNINSEKETEKKDVAEEQEVDISSNDSYDDFQGNTPIGESEDNSADEVDTNINSQNLDLRKITAFIENANVTSDKVSNPEITEKQVDTNINSENNPAEQYGTPEELEQKDLGEPIKETQKEVKSDGEGYASGDSPVKQWDEPTEEFDGLDLDGLHDACESIESVTQFEEEFPEGDSFNIQEQSYDFDVFV